MLKIFRLLRPSHYIKQVFVLLPCLSLGRNAVFQNFIDALLAVACFSFLASAIYITNDLKDLASDKLHPYKKNRPIASGQVSKSIAILAVATCIVFSTIILSLISANLFELSLIAFSYLALNLFYTGMNLKKYNLIGMSIVAIGFPIRFTFGTIAIGADVSYWGFLLCFSLAIFLLTGKRIQQELLRAPQDGTSANHFILAIFASVFLAEYIGFVVSSDTQDAWGDTVLILTPIPVSLVIARYFEIVMNSKLLDSKDVTEVFYRDLLLFFSSLAYALLMFFASYSA